MPHRTLLLCFLLAPVAAADTFELQPIQYSKTEPRDAIAKLAQRIKSGQTKLAHDDRHGYLPALLKELKIPVSSQVLVFSKTSFQRDKIGPERPRAIYYNDDVYVGSVQGGDVLEISSTDPNLGPIFYTMNQEARRPAAFARQTDSCLQCHASSMTGDMPGHMIRSVYPDADGLPILSAGSYRTNHTSPFIQRWGGWYVTGTSGGQKHMGNVVSADRDDVEKTNFGAGTNVTRLDGKFDTAAYLSPHSDIVALMVLEHQAMIHNLITRANMLTRLALHDCAELNKALGRPADYQSESTISRIKNAGEPLVKGLLMCGETALISPVQGTSGFAKEFCAGGVRDAKGRSLRELDLKTRMFKYPCSYLVHGQAFAALPKQVQAYVNERLLEVLSGKDKAKEFAHLSAGDRAAILEILREAKVLP